MSLSYGSIVRKDITSAEGLLPASFEGYTVAAPGDTVMRLTDLQNDQRSLRTGLVREDGIITSAYLTLRPGPLVEPRFFAYALAEKDFSKVLYGLGGGMRQSLSMEDIAGLRLWLPSLDEQRRIADFLDFQVSTLAMALEARSRQAGLIEDARRATLAELFWSSPAASRKLGQLVEISHGRQRSPEHESGPFMTPYLRSANVSDGRLDLEDVKEMNFTPRERDRFGLLPGDVLVTEAAGSAEAIGASAQWHGEVTGPVCFQNHVVRLRPRTSSTSADYIYWWARSSYASGAMRSWATGASILNLGSAALARMPFPELPLPEQARVVDECHEADSYHRNARAAVERAAALLVEFKGAVISAAVTGQLDPSTMSDSAGKVAIA